MASFRSHRNSGIAFLSFLVGSVMFAGWPPGADAQQQQPQPQQVQGFAVERFYPSAPGAGWFVMDDLSMRGGFGGAISLTPSYSRNPLQVSSPDGTQQLALVSNEAFLDLGVAVTYDRFRGYVDVPMPAAVNGNSGTLGLYQFTAPSVSLGTNPDAVSDPRIGFDARLFGKPGNKIRLGVGAQLLFPAGNRADYLTDGTFRGMVRFLAAGDAGRYSYAGQLGAHIRPLNDSPAPGSPNGSEFLFGVSGGRRFSVRPRWVAIVGPEFYGETAFHSFFNGETGVEGLLTTRFEGTGEGRRLRFKVGIGHGIDQHFGAPEWRILFGVELFGQHASRDDAH